MFGDAFGQRSDYSLGIFYANNRKYLHDTKSKNALEPPREMMTKKQARHHRNHQEAVHATEEKNFVVAFPLKKDDDSSIRKFRKTTRLIRNAHAAIAATASPEDWVEEFQAGMWLWINKKTGEVLSECPWSDSNSQCSTHSMSSSFDFASKSERFRSKSSKSSKSSRSITSLGAATIVEDEDEEEENVSFGTGSLVYDSSEVDELFAMLEKSSRK